MKTALMVQASAQVHPLNTSTPPLPYWAMPWVALVVELLYFSHMIFSLVVEVLVAAVWLICFLVEWFLKIGWTYLEI